MKLAHAVDHRLTGFLVRANPEGRILFSQAGERVAHLVLVGAVFGSIETEITGSGKLIDSRRIGLRWIAERVAGEGVLESDDGDDVAGADRLHFFAVIGMHLQQAADPLAIALASS